MKALVYTEPRKLEFREWPDPKLDSGDALVRVHAVAVCGSDLHGWLGHSRGRVPPLVLGHEMAGAVVVVREEKAAVKPGDRVAVYPIISCNQCSYCVSKRGHLCRRRQVLGLHVPGGFAEYLKVPAQNLYLIPEEMGDIRGALVEPLATALHMVGMADQDRGPVAILGAGPIGLLALAAARQLNFTKIAVAEVNPNRSAVALQLGADLVVNPKDSDAQAVLERFFGEDGCFAVFDAAGFSATRRLALQLVRTGGLIVQAGLGEAETSFDFVELVRREIRVAGSYAYSRLDFQTALEWLAGKRMSLDPWISEAPLAEGQAVFEDLARPDSTRIKVVLKP